MSIKRKPKIILNQDTIKMVEEILTLDETVKIIPTKNGIAVYREKLKKTYTQSQAGGCKSQEGLIASG